MSWTLTTASAAIIKAGENANATIVADATTLAIYSDMAEGRIEMGTKRTWVANHATLPTGIKGILNAVASSMVANDIIIYNAKNYLSNEQTTLLNYNDKIIEKEMVVLKNFKNNELKAP